MRKVKESSRDTVTAVAAAVTYAIVSPFADLSLALDCKYHICPETFHEIVRIPEIPDKLTSPRAKDRANDHQNRRLTSCFVFAVPIHLCSIDVLKRRQEENDERLEKHQYCKHGTGEAGEKREDKKHQYFG